MGAKSFSGDVEALLLYWKTYSTNSPVPGLGMKGASIMHGMTPTMLRLSDEA